MKTVRMSRAFDYQANSRAVLAFKNGQTYEKVIDAAADAIVAAGAGKIVEAKSKRKREE